MYLAGSAYIQLLPSLRGFGSSAASQIKSQLADVGEPAGQQVGRNVGGGVETGLTGALTRLRGRFDDLARSGATSMSTLARGTAPVLDQFGRLYPVLGRVRDGFTDSNAAASVFSGTAGTVGGRLRTVVDQTSRVGSQFTAMSTLSAGALSRTGSAITRGLTAPIRGAGTVLAGFGLSAGTIFTGAGVAAVGMGLKFAASQEQAEMAFSTMLGSAQQAQRFVAQLQDFAAKTPFDLPSVTTGSQRLMAFGFAAQDVLPTLTAIGDAVAGMGGSADQINQVVLAVGQMQAKGKVQGDEILQLTEAGIPALRILANQYGVTTSAMQDMISKGVVASAEAIPKLMSGIEQGTRGAAGETQAFAGMMSNQATTLTGIWSNFTDNVNQALGRLVAPALPLVKSALGGLTEGLGALPDLITRFQQAARPAAEIAGAAFRDFGAFVTDSVLPALGNLWSAVQPVAEILGGALLAGLRLAGSVLRDVLGLALVTVSEWLRPLMPLLVGIAAGFAAWYGIAATVATVAGAIGFVQKAIMAVRIAWLALSLAFTASPIGFVIALVAGLVAGVIYAWNNFEGFRDVVLACWSAIQTAALWAWQNALKPALDGIASAAVAVGEFFVTIWQNGVVVAFQAVGAAASWLWSNVLSPVFGFIGLAARTLVAVIVTVLVAPWVIAFQALAAIATWLWANALSPFFSWVGERATALWTGYIKPAIDAIVGALIAFGDWCTWLWQAKISPALAGIGQAFVWLYDHSIGWVVGVVVDGLRRVGDTASWLWQQKIVPAWTGIGNTISSVYNGTIGVVFGWIQWGLGQLGDFFTWIYQQRIRPAWDAVGAVIGWVYANAISPAFEAAKSAVRSVGEAFDQAVTWIGDVWSKIKNIAATPVNFVIDWVYNRGIRAVWNWVADFLGLGKLQEAAMIPTFAGGGLIPGYEPGRDTMLAWLSPGEAVLTPEATRMVGPANVLALNAAASGRAATVGDGDGFPRFAGGGIVDTLLSFAEGIGENATALFKDPIGWIKSRIGFPDSPWITMLAKMPAELIGKSVHWLWEKINPFAGSGGGAPTVGGDLAGWIRTGMMIAGVPASWEGPLRTLIMRESGGNPRAINNWDVNAQRGDPSRGLMQTIGGTFSAYRDKRLSADIYDPIANIVAGINYIKARYGSVFNVQQAVGSTPRGYDSGGWLPPGLSTVYNGTGKPEAVFTHEQYEALAGQLQAQREPSASVTVYARTDADPQHIAHTVDRHLALGTRL
ncbi:tape measure protein [Saccharopolyspora spinosa]|uniref:Tape measure domain-containing protein n=1 Tax=Saccharopolyspora spinosa TaxID=60894 RepID=A0A2N3XZ82_SACSN|nr:tape measure protein [Saccharopolyspora spinosa]PKW15921.1 tape measure domain-containing protein [Saccharopolyspora spinosa]